MAARKDMGGPNMAEEKRLSRVQISDPVQEIFFTDIALVSNKSWRVSRQTVLSRSSCLGHEL